MHVVSVYACVLHWDHSAALYCRQQFLSWCGVHTGYAFYGTLLPYLLDQILLSFISSPQTVVASPHMLNETNTALK